MRFKRPSWWPGNADPEPIAAPAGGEEAEHYRHLEIVARRAADLAGAFSLFALISVLALAAGAKQLALPLPSLFQPDVVWATLYLPWIVPFVIGAVALWVLNRHWLKMALALRFRRDWKAPLCQGDGTPLTKLFVIAVGFIIAGAVIVLATKLQDTGQQIDAREGAIVEQQAAAGRAALEAQREQVKAELADMMSNANPWLAQAASVGAAEWERSYVQQARETDDPRLPMLERALGAARAADAKRAEIRDLTTQIAMAPVAAETAAQVELDRGAIDWVTKVFAVVPLWLALAIEAIALVMKFVETVFRRLRLEALARAQAAPAPPVAPALEAKPETAEPPPENVIRLADWRDKDDGPALVNETGEAVQEVLQARRTGRKAAA